MVSSWGFLSHFLFISHCLWLFISDLTRCASNGFIRSAKMLAALALLAWTSSFHSQIGWAWYADWFSLRSISIFCISKLQPHSFRKIGQRSWPSFPWTIMPHNHRYRLGIAFGDGLRPPFGFAIDISVLFGHHSAFGRWAAPTKGRAAPWNPC